MSFERRKIDLSITCGFFNSLNGDRKYDAEQLSSIFDGIIGDGVFASIGTAFSVSAAGGLTVNVGDGKAWFNHTWTLNDSIFQITMSEAEMLRDRIDAIVIEINNSDTVRTNTIKPVKGTPSSSPIKPKMVKENGVHQHPLCYIFRKAGSTEIKQSDITSVVGSDETPFVTGILQTITLNDIIGKIRETQQAVSHIAVPGSTDKRTNVVSFWNGKKYYQYLINDGTLIAPIIMQTESSVSAITVTSSVGIMHGQKRSYSSGDVFSMGYFNANAGDMISLYTVESHDPGEQSLVLSEDCIHQGDFNIVSDGSGDASITIAKNSYGYLLFVINQSDTLFSYQKPHIDCLSERYAQLQYGDANIFPKVKTDGSSIKQNDEGVLIASAKIVALTQAQYDALTPDNETLYLIVPEVETSETETETEEAGT